LSPSLGLGRGNCFNRAGLRSTVKGSRPCSMPSPIVRRQLIVDVRCGHSSVTERDRSQHLLRRKDREPSCAGGHLRRECHRPCIKLRSPISPHIPRLALSTSAKVRPRDPKEPWIVVAFGNFCGPAVPSVDDMNTSAESAEITSSPAGPPPTATQSTFSISEPIKRFFWFLGACAKSFSTQMLASPKHRA
jgi:hypothetical protein